MSLLVDLDDFCDDDRSRADLARLDELKERIPKFAATLFTIPGRCTREFVEYMKETRPWLDLVPHGWMHESNYECRDWTKFECKEALRRARDIGITTRGFKAPGWQISDGCYAALVEEGYWCADQVRSRDRWPVGLVRYCIDDTLLFSVLQVDGKTGHAALLSGPPTKIHGHIGSLNCAPGQVNPNALELIMPAIIEAAERDTDFRFINEVMS